jgi:hypothetical protein
MHLLGLIVNLKERNHVLVLDHLHDLDLALRTVAGARKRLRPGQRLRPIGGASQK